MNSSTQSLPMRNEGSNASISSQLILVGMNFLDLSIYLCAMCMQRLNSIILIPNQLGSMILRLSCIRILFNKRPLSFYCFSKIVFSTCFSLVVGIQLLLLRCKLNINIILYIREPNLSTYTESCIQI